MFSFLNKLQFLQDRSANFLIGAAVAVLVRLLKICPQSPQNQALLLDLKNFLKDVRLTKKAQKLIQQTNFKDLSSANLANLKKSETLFILGSGSSINQLTQVDWEQIAGADSIGFNFWLIHRFVPTYYFFETSSNQKSYAVFQALLKLRAEAYLQVPLVCQYKQWLTKGRTENDLKAFPSQISNNLHLYAPFNVHTKSPEAMAALLNLWRALGLLKPETLIHHRASLSTLVMFAAAAGYKKIVLLGIDLNDTKHFWEDDAASYEGVPQPENEHKDKGPIHGTVADDPNRRALPVDKYLEVFHETILKPAGIELYVGSKVSRLYPRLPLYPAFECS